MTSSTGDNVTAVLAPYATVLRTPGSMAFVSAGFVARLPIAMIGLGIVLYISGLSGSYARAGLLTATFALSAAVAALFTSRLSDRLGQRAVLPILIIVHGAALVGFVLTTTWDQSFVMQFLVIALAGATQPAIGSMVRARWVFVLHRPTQVRTAFALESILDELIFTLGPLIATTLALQVALPLPLLVGAVLAVVGTLALASQRRTEPPPNPTRTQHRGSAIRYRGMPAMVLIAIGSGMVFGSFEVSVVAFTRAQGAPGASGVVLALWAGASLIGGLWFGSRSWRRPLPTLLAGFSALLMVAVAPTPFVPNIAILAVTSVVSGFAIAPALISLFALTERLIPQMLLTEGLTWSNSGLALGFAIGTSVAGVLIDATGPWAGFTLVIAAAALSTVTALVARPLLIHAQRPHAETSEIAIPLNDDPIGPGPTAH